MIPFFKSNQPSRNARAVVTGAGGGMGRGYALEVARAGGAVVCADNNEEAIQETVTLNEEQGGTAFEVKCDVSKAAQIRSLAAQSAKLFAAPVTMLINNAGVGVG